MSGAALAALLADPARASVVTDWTGVLCAARAERLLASLAHRLDGLELPRDVHSILDAAKLDAEQGRVQALWEAEMARRALAGLDVPVVLLKGTAFVAAGMAAGQGRLIGDLDILVPRDRLDAVEAALLAAGWGWVKPDVYDDLYYRRWMHELPPLIHADRDRMIDVHHTILPLTARPTPDAAALIADSIVLANGLRILSPEDMVVHAAAHLFADGDLAGGLRNLWDIRLLVDEVDPSALDERAKLHGLLPEVERALRLCRHIFVAPAEGHPVKYYLAGTLEAGFARKSSDFAVSGPGLHRGDGLYAERLLARDGWGRPTRPLLRFAFYLRSHLIRMPLPLLFRHLWTKWRKRG